MQKYTIRDFNTQFPDDAACLDWLRDYLYPNGIECPKCHRITKHHRVVSRRSYSCDVCGHHVHPTADTIYHKSSTSLRLWFYAVYLMSATRSGISAKQLERELGVTYKTAWRMFRQIRIMREEDVPPFTGHVEADETYIGARDKRGTKRGRPGPGSHKATVFGIVERQGKVVARVTSDSKARTLMPIIRDQVTPLAVVSTDEFRTYHGLTRAGYAHRTVNHAAKVYVDGSVHTNTIEGFWSLIKRGIGGVYHAVSPRHLQHYLDEYTFRYNHRGDATPMFTTMLSRVEKQG